MADAPHSSLKEAPRWDAFDPVDAATWRARVEADLKGRPFDVLVDRSVPNVEIAPVYGRDDAPASDAYARGRGDGGWRIAVEHRVEGDGHELDARIEHDAGFGATLAWLRGPGAADDERLGQWRAALGEQGQVYRVVGAERAPATPSVAGVHVLLDPLGTVMRGDAPGDAGARGRWAGQIRTHLDGAVARETGDDGLLIDTGPVAAAGGDVAEQLGAFVATGLAYLRLGVDGGRARAEVATRCWASFELGRDLFVEIAKLRAARRLWAKLLVALGEDDPRVLSCLRVQAGGSRRVRTQRDPWVNLLRGTTETFAAAVGGADVISTLPLDAVSPSHPRHGGDFGRRLAINTQLLLAEESHLGAVADPAGGSAYVEALTDQIARSGWAAFQRIEAEGGIVESLLGGALRARVDARHEADVGAVARRKLALVGVSEFATLEEHTVPGGTSRQMSDAASPVATDDGAVAPWPVRRLAEPFEQLRARADASTAARGGQRPLACLVGLGPLREHKPRADFAANLLAAGGFVTTLTEPVEDVATAPAAVAAAAAAADVARPDVVVLCGSDERYASDAPVAARALGASKPGWPLALAGRPGALETVLAEAGLSTFLYLGCDAIAVLDALLPDADAEVDEHA